MRIAIALLAILSGTSLIHAEVTNVTLPQAFTDFALNPVNGDLVGILGPNDVQLFPATALKEKAPRPAVKIKVGTAPSSIVYKEYGKQKLYAVVCSEDANMYLLNAADLSLVKKIPLTKAGVSYVTASSNQGDPFVYYNCVEQSDSIAAVVNLRDMVDVGPIKQQSSEWIISPDGDVAYNRGASSPAGYESLERVNSFADIKPVFMRYYYEPKEGERYVPDPSGWLTGIGKKLTSKLLDKEIAVLDYPVSCYLHKTPAIICAIDRPPANSERSTSRMLSLNAVSYNTFKNIGRSVLADIGPSPAFEFPAAIGRRVTPKLHVFPDEARKQLVVAYRDCVAVVPLEDFDLPKETFLSANFTKTKFAFGESATTELQLLDPKIEFAFDSLPENIKVEGNKLTWTPESQDIGTTTFFVNLKSKTVQKMLPFQFTVEYPSLALPFVAGEFAIDAGANRMILVEHRSEAPLDGNQNAKTPIEMALIDLKSGEVLKRTKTSEAIKIAKVTKDYVAFLNPAVDNRCDLIGFKDLERAKGIVASDRIIKVDSVGKNLLLVTKEGIEVYDLETFKRIKTFSRQEGQVSLMALGMSKPLVVGGAIKIYPNLYSADLKLQLLADTAELLNLDTSYSPRSSFSIDLEPPSAQSPFASRPHMISPPQIMPGSRTNIGVEAIFRTGLFRREDNSIYMTEVTAIATGDIEAIQPLVRLQRSVVDSAPAIQPRPVLNFSQFSGIQPVKKTELIPLPVFQVSSTEVYVAYKQSLYRWMPKEVDPSRKRTSGFAFAPQQSALALSGPEKCVLTHKIIGGTAPVTYQLEKEKDWLAIDEKTGNVTIDEGKALEIAYKVVLQSIPSPKVQELQKFLPRWKQLAAEYLGREPKGIPFAIPVFVGANDSDGQKTQIGYFVLAELPLQPVVDKLRQFDAEQPKRASAPPAPGSPPGTPVPNAAKGAGDVADLRRRIDSLEGRLDLLTRQLSDVLKRLDK